MFFLSASNGLGAGELTGRDICPNGASPTSMSGAQGRKKGAERRGLPARPPNNQKGMGDARPLD
jgi:hypothetical protein